MKKEIQSIYFDESNDNYYIDHNQGVDIINRKEIRAAIYSEKLTLECESNYSGFFFIYQKFKDLSGLSAEYVKEITSLDIDQLQYFSNILTEERAMRFSKKELLLKL